MFIRQKSPAPVSATIAGVMDDGRVITIQPPPHAHNNQPRRWFGRSPPAEGLPRYEPAVELPSYQDSQHNARAAATSRPSTTPPRALKQKRKLNRRGCFCALIGFLVVAIAVVGFLLLRPHKHAEEIPTHDHDTSGDWSPTWNIEQSHVPFADVDSMREDAQGIVARDIGCEQFFHDASCDMPNVQVPPVIADNDVGARMPQVETVAERDGATVVCHVTVNGRECRSLSTLDDIDLSPPEWTRVPIATTDPKKDEPAQESSPLEGCVTDRKTAVCDTTSGPEREGAPIAMPIAERDEVAQEPPEIANDEGNPGSWHGRHLENINHSPVLRKPSAPHVSPGDVPAAQSDKVSEEDVLSPFSLPAGSVSVVEMADEAAEEIPPHKYLRCLEDPPSLCEGVPVSPVAERDESTLELNTATGSDPPAPPWDQFPSWYESPYDADPFDPNVQRAPKGGEFAVADYGAWFCNYNPSANECQNFWPDYCRRYPLAGQCRCRYMTEGELCINAPPWDES